MLSPTENSDIHTNFKTIVITGAKRSGKDTLASYISSKYQYKHIAFAEPLKNVVKALFDFNSEQIGDGDDKDVLDYRWGITPRKALQFFGTEVLQYKIQELLPNIERKFLTYSLISKIKNSTDCHVISDLRFLHEYDEITKLGAFIIRIDRPLLNADNQNLDVHSSEIEYRQIPYHLHIHNDSDIAGLIRKFEEGMALHLSKSL